jgi:outer membrane protein assembly factor BamB
MTDDELLEMVQTKAPEELTREEVVELRSRLADSEPLRTALFQTLQMEAYLATALGPTEIRPELIVAKAERWRENRFRMWTWVALGMGCILFLGLSFGVLRSALIPEPVVASHDTPERTPEEPESITEGQSPADPPAAREAAPAVGPPAVLPPAEKSPMPPPADDPPAAPAPPPEPQRTEPWHAVTSQAAEQLPSFYDTCFQNFAYRSVLPSSDDLKQWFEAVPGQGFGIHDASTQKGKCARIEGFARLRAPLPADGGVRFALEGSNRLAIHAFNGEQGVMLVYYEDLRNRWVAYTTTRKAGEPKPSTFAVTATDDERARRAEIRYGGPLELRYHAGRLLLLRGDIVLLAAPLPAPPSDIYFEGKAIFEGLALVRTHDFPLPQDPPAAGQVFRPAELAWSDKVSEGAKFEKLDDGSVRLTSVMPKEHTNLVAPLPGTGYREVVLELRDVSPGFGVFLGHDDAQVRQLVRVVRDNRNQRLRAVYRGPDDFYEGDFPRIEEQPQVACGSNLWVKLLYGNGMLKWWVSADGEHWALGDLIPDQAEGRITSLGITTCRTKEVAAGTLASVTVRELPALNGLAPRELVERAPLPGKTPTFESWLAAVVESCPAGTDLASWRRASAVRALGFGMPTRLAQKMLESLLDDPATQALPPEQQRAVLCEVMQVEADPRDSPTWKELGWKRGYLSRFADLGRRLGEQEGTTFSAVRRAAMQTPTWSLHPLPVVQEGQVEEELVQLLQRGRSEQTLAFCEMLRLYHFHENRPLIDWAEVAARRDVGRITGVTARIKESWRHPLIEELNKEVYNFASDLQGLVDSGALEDAGRMIASLDADRGGGLTPSGQESDLFVSLAVAVKLALAHQPALREELNRALAPLAQLRVRQAIASGDDEVIELAATQFEGTPAAAEAYRWAGDHALQNGWFARALAEYRRAEQAASGSLARDIGPRARLAAAMLGLDHGTPLSEPVSLGSTTISAGEFETLVTEMKARAAGNVHGSLGGATTVKLPNPSQLQPTNRARFEGVAGQNPHDDGARFISQWQIDFVGRQLATVVAGDTFYVSNRFQISAYNAASGQRLWQSAPPPGEMRRGQDWPLVAMQPLVTPGAIYARQLYGNSPSLCGFEKATGKLLWHRPGTDQEWWVGDPIFVQGQLLALNLSRDGNREMHLRLASLDPLTGDVLVQRKLLGLRESWQHFKTCEVTPLSDGMIASVAGFTLSCDAGGRVRWIRKHLLLPHEERPQWVHQFFTPPLLADDRVVVLQPGVESVDCLDVSTGRRHWSYRQERAHRLLGHSQGLVFLATESGIVALQLNDGSVAWRRRESLPRLTAAVANEQYVMYMVKRGERDQPQLPVLLWLDSATGEMRGTAEFAAWQDKDPRIGPLLPAGDRLWTFSGKEKDTNRDLVELTAGAPLAASLPTLPGAWQQLLPSALIETVAEVAPAWQLVSGYGRSNAEKKSAWQGETDAAVILSKPELPLVLTAQADLPPGKMPKLQLRLGHEGSQPGEFQVRIDGEKVFTQEWKAENANRWDSFSFDLSKYAGKQVVISLAYHPSTGNDHALWLKTANIALD